MHIHMYIHIYLWTIDMTLGTICVTREVIHKLQEQLYFVEKKKKKNIFNLFMLKTVTQKTVIKKNKLFFNTVSCFHGYFIWQNLHVFSFIRLNFNKFKQRRKPTATHMNTGIHRFLFSIIFFSSYNFILNKIFHHNRFRQASK